MGCQHQLSRLAFSPTLLLAAFLFFRFSADMPAARAFPHDAPNATAAAFLPSSVRVFLDSPVAIFMTWMALADHVGGRFFSPFWSFGHRW